MTFLQAVILHCLHKVNSERTIYSIFHLLTGKKSSQTIQDGHLYDMLTFFKVLPRLKRQQYDLLIEQLKKQQYIHFPESNLHAVVSNQGQEAYIAFFQKHPFPTFIQGWKFQDASIQMWKRLTLLIQAISHFNYSSTRYYPIQRDPDTATWVKQYILRHKNISQLKEQLYNELFYIFSNDFPEEPNFIIERFSGYEKIGLTGSQIAEKYTINEIEAYFRYLNCLHYIVEKVASHKDQFSVLFSLIQDVFKQVPFTQSTLYTYNLLHQNYSIDEIARIRQLKVSTIEDHIIEIAYADPHFSITPFIDEHLVKRVSEAANKLGIKKLKPIKECVKESSYFQIRLVLARAGVKR